MASETDPCKSEPLSGWQKQLAVVGTAVESRFDDFRKGLKHRLGLTDPVNLQLYRSYGTTQHVTISGRLLEDEQTDPPTADDSRWENIVRAYRLIETDEVSGGTVELEYAGQTVETQSNEEGFFTATFSSDGEPFPVGASSFTGRIVGLPSRYGEFDKKTFESTVHVPAPGVGRIVVSDVDDTVMQTEATSLVRMVANTVLNNAYDRVAFPGVGAFYESLLKKDDGIDDGAMFYLTSSMWNVYDIIRLFLRINDIPPGPIMMRDLGLTNRQLFKGTHSQHKLCRVRELLELYPDKTFVLIGDTGQHDAEIYRDVAKRAAGRIEAVYLREVDSSDRYAGADQAMRDLQSMNVPALFADDTAAMAEHASQHGLVSDDVVAFVETTKQRDEQRATSSADA
jgi:phosphatidate phosphatase APP1